MKNSVGHEKAVA